MSVITQVKVPTDIGAVKKYGIEKWREEFFWPIGDDEFISLCEDIENCMADIIEKDREVGDLFLIAREIPFYMWHLFHALKVIKIFKQDGCDILYSEKSFWFKDLIEKNALEKKYRVFVKSFARKSLTGRAWSNVKRKLREVYFNIENGTFLFKKSPVLKTYACGGYDPLAGAYIKRNPGWVHILNYPDMFAAVKETFSYAPEFEKRISEITGELTGKLENIASKYDVPLAAEHLDFMRTFVATSLEGAYQIAKKAEIIVAKFGKIHLLVTGLGNRYHKALSIAVRNNGGRVTSFAHGSNFGLWKNPPMGHVEFAMSDEFVSYVSESVEVFERILKEIRIVRNNKVDIVSCESRKYLEIWRKYSKQEPPKQLKNILMVGFPHNSYRKYMSSNSFSLIHLYIESSVAGILNKHNYNVYYKPHPDRLPEVRGIFEDSTNVITGKFEDYLETADAFVFGSLKTMALSYALCTQKPIIALVTLEDERRISPDVWAALRKRLRVVRLRHDERNRAVFDNDEFMAALTEESPDVDNTFIEKYMIPGNAND